MQQELVLPAVTVRALMPWAVMQRLATLPTQTLMPQVVMRRVLTGQPALEGQASPL
jgi:hypothetical protein